MTLDGDVHQACAELRFAEGLRRRAAEARAEATVWEACSLARLEGARVDPGQLREQIMRWDRGPTDTAKGSADLAVGFAAWRALWTVVSALPELNPRSPQSHPETPLRALLAGAHRDYASVLAAWGLADPAKIAIPRHPEKWGQTLYLLASPQADAVTEAATLWGVLATSQPFDVGSGVVGAVASKHLLARRGVEPTAVSVLSLHAVEKPGEHLAALDQAARGAWDPWLTFFRHSVIRGAQEGLVITRHVQAQTLP